MATTTNLIDDRAAWLEARRKCITATDAAAILGLNVWSSPYLVYQDKLGLLAEKETTDAMQLGTDLESWIGGIFDRDHNPAKLPMVKADFTLHPEHEYFGATPDFLLGDNAVVECKYAGVNAARAFGDEFTDEVPEHYLIQVQWQLFCTGRKLGYLAVFAPTLASRIRVYEIERNDKLIDTAAARLKKFWFEHVLKEIPPAISGSRADSRHVDEKYADAPKDSIAVRATPELEEVVAKAAALKAKAKDVTEAYDACINQIKAYMGEEEADTLLTDIGPFKWKEQTRNYLSNKAAAKMLADNGIAEKVMEQYLSTTTTRVLRTPFKSEG